MAGVGHMGGSAPAIDTKYRRIKELEQALATLYGECRLLHQNFLLPPNGSYYLVPKKIQYIFTIGLSANLLSSIQTLINQNLYISQTYTNFSQSLSTFIKFNVYCCKGQVTTGNPPRIKNSKQVNMVITFLIIMVNINN